MGSRRKGIWLGAFLLLATVFLLLAFRGQWSALDDAWATTDGGWRFRVGWLLAALALGVSNLLGMATLWTWLARKLGQGVTYREGTVAWLGANLGRYIPGKVWQLAGLAAYLKGRGRSGSTALVAALVFQIVILLSGIAVVLLTLRGQASAAFGGSLVPPLTIIVALAATLHPAVLRRATRVLGRWLKEDTETDALPHAGEGSRHVGWVLGAALLPAWGVYGVGLWCLTAGVSAGPVGGDVWSFTGVFAGSYVAGYLSLVTPGGLIVREGVMTLLLAAVTPIPAAMAAVLAVLARLWTIVSEITAFGVAAAAGGVGHGSGARRKGGPSMDRSGGE